MKTWLVWLDWLGSRWDNFILALKGRQANAQIPRSCDLRGSTLTSRTQRARSEALQTKGQKAGPHDPAHSGRTYGFRSSSPHHRQPPPWPSQHRLPPLAQLLQHRSSSVSTRLLSSAPKERLVLLVARRYLRDLMCSIMGPFCADKYWFCRRIIAPLFPTSSERGC